MCSGCKWESQPLGTTSVQHFSLEWPKIPNAKTFTLFLLNLNYPVFYSSISSQLHAQFIHAESAWNMPYVWVHVIFNFSLNIFWDIGRLFFSVFYKLLICWCKREILKRFGQKCMLSLIKWSLSASPSGILLQRCSSAGCFWYLFWFHCGSIPPPLVNLLSSRTKDCLTLPA